MCRSSQYHRMVLTCGGCDAPVRSKVLDVCITELPTHIHANIHKPIYIQIYTYIHIYIYIHPCIHALAMIMVFTPPFP